MGDAIFEKHVQIEIEQCVNEMYSVTLTEDNYNDEVARGIGVIKDLPKAKTLVQ